jgi:hypothetical protein
MEISETMACPFCGQFNEIMVDTSIANQKFVTDCVVCCRPFDVIAECEDGEILNLETVAN